MIWLLVACAKGPWTEDAAVSPVRARLDRNGDGRVDAAEFDPVAFEVTFDEVDADHDGDLSTAELLTRLHATDPSGFWAWDVAIEPAADGEPAPLPDRPRHVWMALMALRDEALFANPAAPVPTLDEMEAVRSVEDYRDPAVATLLRRLIDAGAKVPPRMRRIVEGADPPAGR